MSNVVKVSRTGTEKRPLDLVRLLAVILQRGGCESQVTTPWDEKVGSKEQAMVQTLKREKKRVIGW